MRVGLSLAEAYQEMGLRHSAPDRDVKAAYRKFALENHPDKVKGEPDSADVVEAAARFMKVARAFETIMEARKGRGAAPNATGRQRPAPKRG